MQPTNQRTPTLFSVLIANYNNGQYLQECLDSVFAQTYTNWEIILVDDSSDDETSRKIYKKYNTHPRIKIFYNQENFGCGYTKRKCVEAANGAICAFLDPDDAIPTDAIQTMVDKHMDLPKHSLIYSTNYLCDEQLSVISKNPMVGMIGAKGYFCNNGKHSNVSHFASFKTDHYRKTDGINPKLKRAVDQDLYYKMEETGPFYYIDRPLYYYRRHKGGISTAKNALKAKYWHVIVSETTWLRRQKAGYQPNRLKKEIKKQWSDYYFWKAQEKAKKGRVIKTIIFVCKTIFYSTSGWLEKIFLIPFSAKIKLQSIVSRSNSCQYPEA